MPTIASRGLRITGTANNRYSECLAFRVENKTPGIAGIVLPFLAPNLFSAKLKTFLIFRI